MCFMFVSQSEADRNPDDFSDNLTERIDPETHPKTRLDPETHPKTRLDPETHPKTRLDPETQHKITYEYSSRWVLRLFYSLTILLLDVT